jgi:hypothetical protein
VALEDNKVLLILMPLDQLNSENQSLFTANMAQNGNGE